MNSAALKAAEQATREHPRNRLCRAAGVRPLEGAEGRGSKPACAGLDVPEEQPPLAAARQSHTKWARLGVG
jgi:hypothetical protein